MKLNRDKYQVVTFNLRICRNTVILHFFLVLVLVLVVSVVQCSLSRRTKKNRKSSALEPENIWQQLKIDAELTDL